MISFATSKSDQDLIAKIVKRACKLFPNIEAINISMDITAVHANGCPLRLADLLAADDFNFISDISGINRYLNRETGVLVGFFEPRFAA